MTTGRPRDDLVELHFGSWRVFAYAYSKNNSTHWHVKCRCGAERVRQGSALRSGKSKMCLGCHGVRARVTHGMTTHPLYSTWKNMRNRCMSEKNKDFKDYGGRGIKVCSRWDDFSVFCADVGERPPGMTLDRKDNDGDYEPSNVRWATKSEQRENQRSFVRQELGIAP